MALKAADALASEGIEAEVIDLRTIRPMDVATVVRSIQKTNRCVAIEEAGRPKAASLPRNRHEDHGRSLRLSRCPGRPCHGKDVPMPYASNLEKLALPNVARSSRRPRPCCIAEHQDRGESPMPINILMPALSPTMEKGNLAKWLKKRG